MAHKEWSATAKIAGYLSRLSPVPAFPEYTGPYKVGSMDVEVPVSDLDSPSPAPSNAADICTVQFRVFYPAVHDSDQRPISWLPTPQRNHVSAYTKFIGIGPTLAEVLSFLPRHLHYTTIPVHKNAEMEQPDTPNKRWPVMIFSHGLGGSRNSYSYIAGSLASHGIVVVCPEHRDGSAVMSFIRIPRDGGLFAKVRRSVPYRRITHEMSPDVYDTREAQLRIRLWELGLVHQAVLAMDLGSGMTNLNTSTPSLAHFVDKLHVHEPGSIIFAGHSFGAATTCQLLKCTYYADRPEVASIENPLFRPAKDSAIRAQITEKSATMLLDMWCLPLLAPNSAVLFDLPLPVYTDVPSAPGGNGLLAVESETFFKWTEHLHIKARLLSADPSAKVVSPQSFQRPSGINMSEPNFFYVANSAHLSQSDFGILFPWLTKKIFDAEQPERALRLNLRAQLQFLRVNNVPVARTWVGDLVENSQADELLAVHKIDGDASSSMVDDGVSYDAAIYNRSDSGVVKYWSWIDTIGLGESGEAEKGKTASEQVEEADQQMKGEIEPGEQTPPALVRTFSHVSAAAA